MIPRPAFSACLLATAALALAPAAHAEPDVYLGLNLVDPQTETIQPDAYVVVEDGRIVEIGQGAPRPVKAGCTISPACSPCPA